MLMRRFLLAFAVVALFTTTSLVRAEDTLWQTDFDKAKTQAKAEKKLLLVDFTGSDWCTWCQKLQTEVFGKEAFKAGAPKQFVLVELDFPRGKKKLSEKVAKANDTLAKQYKVQGFPTILVLDADGSVMAKTGYRPGGAEKYVEHLGDLVKSFEIFQTLKKGLPNAKGIDKAKLLDPRK